MNTDLVLYGLNANAPATLKGFRHVIAVQEFECGLLYRYGKFVGQLAAGRHARWGLGFGLLKVDMRKQTFPVSGQELLTADNVALKLSVALTAQVTDAAKAMHAVQDWRAHVYNATQLSLRAIVAAEQVEALLAKRVDLGKQLLAAVQPEGAKIGITIDAAEVKDVMFPGELKKAFAEVLKAKQEGQAALERARGESAALRNLANAARLLEANPALQNLRLMQSISAPGNTLVMGLPAGFVPLKQAKSDENVQSGKANEAGEK